VASVHAARQCSATALSRGAGNLTMA